MVAYIAPLAHFRANKHMFFIFSRVKELELLVDRQKHEVTAEKSAKEAALDRQVNKIKQYLMSPTSRMRTSN